MVLVVAFLILGCYGIPKVWDNEWETISSVTPQATQRQIGGYNTINDTIYLFGGTSVSNVWIFDSNEHFDVKMAAINLFEGNIAQSYATKNNIIYFLWHNSNLVRYYNMETETFGSINYSAQFADAWTAMTITDDNSLVFVGALNENPHSYTYNIDDKLFQQLSDVKLSAKGVSLIYFNGTGYVYNMGGSNMNRMQKYPWIGHDVITTQWEILNNTLLPGLRYELSRVFIDGYNDRIIIMTTVTSQTDTIYVQSINPYDNPETVELLPSFNRTTNGNKDSHAFATFYHPINERIYVFAGHGTQEIKSLKLVPYQSPSNSPTSYPTIIPTNIPTISPTIGPSTTPTNTPTLLPSTAPTYVPTSTPTFNSTLILTSTPTISPSETPVPSVAQNSDEQAEKQSNTLLIVLIIVSILFAISIGVIVWLMERQKSIKNQRQLSNQNQMTQINHNIQSNITDFEAPTSNHTFPESTNNGVQSGEGYIEGDNSNNNESEIIKTEDIPVTAGDYQERAVVDISYYLHKQ